MDICRRIDWYLSRNRLTWKNLMEDLGIFPSTVWRWQKNETRPRRTTIRAIETYLGLSDGCLEGRQTSEDGEEITVAADELVLTGEAKRTFEALMNAPTREQQDQMLEELRQRYLATQPDGTDPEAPAEAASATSPATSREISREELAAGDGKL